MIASVPSATLLGVEGRPVEVEVHVSNGLPGFTIVGQPDAACREARDRVRASLLSSGLPWPLRRAKAAIKTNTMASAAGIVLPNEKPLLHFAKELDVLIWPLERAN